MHRELVKTIKIIVHNNLMACTLYCRSIQRPVERVVPLGELLMGIE